jgi:signal-transduction protein with cAMP-binding, CBS, and nucleotidyltransferase domain
MAAMVSLDSWQLPVAEIMKPDVICYSEDTPIRTVYEFLCRVTIRRIIVVRDGIPAGTVSRGTLLRWFRNLVVSKGLVEHKGHEEDRGLDPHTAKERMVKTASQLAHQATELQRRFAENVEDLIPYVVGGATAVQELVDDLLALSRSTNESGSFEPTPHEDNRAGQP